jgi:hypothetical protein
MNRATQRSKILAYFIDHGSITVRDAFEKLHINSPTKRISELRRKGYNIEGIRETRVKENGDTVGYIRYYFRGHAAMPKIREGMKVSFVPGFVPHSNWSLEMCADECIEGVIKFINWDHQNFTAEFDCGGSKQREGFEFSQIGDEVKIHG